MIRGTRVLARCDDDGQLRAESGRVEIRYNPKSDKAYQAAERNLQVVEDAPPIPDSEVAPAAEPSAGTPETKTAATKAAATKKKASKKKAAKKAASAQVPEPPEGAIVAYTDGACSGNPGPAGLGVVIVDGERTRELSTFLGHGTNNVGELAAIGAAADAIEDPARVVHIYTDSTYCIGVLTKGWKAKANRELIGTVKASLQRLQSVTLTYVKAHAGIELNERADGLAVQAVHDRASSGWRDV